MPKLKFKTTKERVKDAQSGGGARVIPPGVYPCRVSKLADVTPPKESGKDRRLEVTCTITRGKEKGWQRTSYIPFTDASEWKLDQLFVALGLVDDKKLSAELDTDHPERLTEFRIRVRPGTFNNEPVSEIAQFLPASEEDDEDEDEDENEGDTGEDEDELTPFDVDDLGELDLDELTELAEEREIDVPKGTPSAKKKKLVAALTEWHEENAEEDGDEDEGEEEGNEYEYALTSDEDVDELELDDLKAAAEERELEVTGKGVALKKKLVAALKEWVEENVEAEDEEEDEPEDEPADYSSMTLAELRALATERKIRLTPKQKALKGTAAKKLLVEKLEAADEADDPFEE